MEELLFRMTLMNPCVVYGSKTFQGSKSICHCLMLVFFLFGPVDQLKDSKLREGRAEEDHMHL